MTIEEMRTRLQQLGADPKPDVAALYADAIRRIMMIYA